MSNEITAYFKGRTGVAESVYQYDYGKVLVIDGLDLPSVFEVHFANSGDDTSIPVLGQNNRVAIPNTCLEKPDVVTAYVYAHAGENDGETEYIVKFVVIQRAMPADDDTSEEAQSAVSQAIALLQSTNANIVGEIEETVSNYMDENADTSIGTWLDDHPEATTTVQDGAITDKKINGSFLSELERVKHFSSKAALKSDADLYANEYVVIEQNTKYDYTGAKYVVREKTNQDVIDDELIIQLDNNDLVAEMLFSDSEMKPLSDGIVYQMMKTALTYFDRNDSKYPAAGSSYHSIFSSDNYHTETVGGVEKYPIDCSTFMQAILQGIDFENSRFKKDRNYKATWGYPFDDADLVSEQQYRDEGLTAAELAKYAYKQGFLYKVKNQTDIKSGDLVFISSFDGTRDDAFLHIDHVFMAFNRPSEEDASVWGIQVGGSQYAHNTIGTCICHLANYNADYDIDTHKLLYYARFPMPGLADSLEPILMKASDITYEATVNRTAGSANSIALMSSIPFNADIKAGEIYTLLIDGNIGNYSDDGSYPLLNLHDGEGNYDTVLSFFKGDNGSNSARMIFTPLRDSSSLSGNINRISLYNNLPDGFVKNVTYKINNIMLFKGIYSGDCIGIATPNYDIELISNEGRYTGALTEIPLKKRMQNYKALIFVTGSNDATHGYRFTIVPVYTFAYKASGVFYTIVPIQKSLTEVVYQNVAISYNNNKITLQNDTGVAYDTLSIRAVYGIR